MPRSPRARAAAAARFRLALGDDDAGPGVPERPGDREPQAPARSGDRDQFPVHGTSFQKVADEGVEHPRPFLVHQVARALDDLQARMRDGRRDGPALVHAGHLVAVAHDDEDGHRELTEHGAVVGLRHRRGRMAVARGPDRPRHRVHDPSHQFGGRLRGQQPRTAPGGERGRAETFQLGPPRRHRRPFLRRPARSAGGAGENERTHQFRGAAAPAGWRSPRPRTSRGRARRCRRSRSRITSAAALGVVVEAQRAVRVRGAGVTRCVPGQRRAVRCQLVELPGANESALPPIPCSSSTAGPVPTSVTWRSAIPYFYPISPGRPSSVDSDRPQHRERDDPAGAAGCPGLGRFSIWNS